MLLTIIIFFFVFIVLCGVRIVDQTERGVVETFGKFSRFLLPGFNWIFILFQGTRRLNITEQMSDIEPQEIITQDNLNAKVDLVVYFKVKLDEENIKKVLYEVNNYESQLILLARTTARNIIGTMKFAEVNSERKKLNDELAKTLRVETNKWGVEIVRVELKEIVPPKDVQETMNSVIKAENAKRAAIDTATARETEADGFARAEIKKAEGQKQAEILKAEGQAKAFDLVNKSFTGNAQLLRALEVTENTLSKNSKIILTDKGITPQLILGDLPITENPWIVGTLNSKNK